jgi:hypothetical protein
MLKGLQAPAIAATDDREFRIEGKAHGQESTVRGYQLKPWKQRWGPKRGATSSGLLTLGFLLPETPAASEGG